MGNVEEAEIFLSQAKAINFISNNYTVTRNTRAQISSTWINEIIVIGDAISHCSLFDKVALGEVNKLKSFFSIKIAVNRKTKKHTLNLYR